MTYFYSKTSIKSIKCQKMGLKAQMNSFNAGNESPRYRAIPSEFLPEGQN